MPMTMTANVARSAAPRAGGVRPVLVTLGLIVLVLLTWWLVMQVL